MKNILKRNKFTLILGIILAVIFIVIIALSQNSETNITLTPAKRNESFNVKKENNKNNPAQKNQSSNTDQTSTNSSTFGDNKTTPKQDKDSTSNIDPLEINFTINGFKPKNPNGFVGQKVIWTNNTNKDMQVKQITKLFENLPELILVEPQQTYEFVIPKEGTWFYKDIVSGWVGRIIIYEK